MISGQCPVASGQKYPLPFEAVSQFVFCSRPYGRKPLKFNASISQAKGSDEKPVIEGLDFVGTGLVPVLTPRRTATRAVPTSTSPC